MKIRCFGVLHCIACDPVIAAFFGFDDPTSITKEIVFDIENVWVFNTANKDNYIDIIRVGDKKFDMTDVYVVQTAHTNTYKTADDGIQQMSLTLGMDRFRITNIHKL